MRLDALHKRNSYSALSLLLVIIAEVIIIWQLKNDSVEFLIPLIIVGIVVLLGIIGWLVGKHKFWPQSSIFTNLMANAIAPSWLGAFYLVLFIVHLAWLSDGTLNLFTSDFLDTPNVLVSIYTSVIGLIILTCYFPDVKPDKSDAKKIVLVAGISKLQAVTTYDFFNLIPLVSFLDLAFKEDKDGDSAINYDNISKMLILNSSIHYKQSFDSPKVNIDITEHKEYKERIDKLKELFKDSIEIEKDNQNKICKIIVTLGKEYDENSNSIKDKLRCIIRDAAMLKYPEHSDLIRKLKIDFTEACDYDRFDQCFQTLDEAIKKEDNNKQLLYFNLTPGTGIVGSLMTLFSIDKDRQLYFFAQNSSKELLPVDKSRLPLENLLSQALEKIKELK